MFKKRTVTKGPSAVARYWEEDESEIFKPEHHERKKPLETPESKTGTEWMTTKRKKKPEEKKPEILAKNSYSEEERDVLKKHKKSSPKKKSFSKQKKVKSFSDTEEEK